MKLGLITDIHEQNELLNSALDRFKQERVDQIVVIGDLLLLGEQIEETCRLLSESGVIGVWGNHDYGLCVEPDERVTKSVPASALDYMSSLRPSLNIEDCYFAHVEPWLDPNEITDLWYFEGPPDEQHKLDRIFNSMSNRLMFAGHYHKWLLATQDGICQWDGHYPICLIDNRFFIVIGALCEGRYAVFDTETSLLTPYNEK